MDIRFFVDENYGERLVTGLRDLGYDNIEHLLENFDRATPDEEWLEYIGERGYVLITRDKMIRRRPNEKAALIRHKIVAFYLIGNSTGTKEISKQLIIAWDRMEGRAKRQKKKGIAGAFNVNRRGKITEIPLT